jgi:hypothetical protein
MTEERDIKYINKDFSDFRNQLIEYAKNYFPDSYNDFSPTSPGMMFIEMAAYVGDILSFYQDIQLQETYLTYAKDPKNLYALAYMMGYKPKVTGVSEVDLTFNQIVSSSGMEYLPAWSEAAIIPSNINISSTDRFKTNFLLNKQVDFSFSSSYDPTEVVIYDLDESSNPSKYRLTKTAKAISAEIVTSTFEIGSVEKFKTLTIEDSNIIGILDIVDSDGNVWYEVPFLGQDTIFADEQNTLSDSNTAPYILTLQKVPRRFVSRFLSTGFLQIQFGAGTNSQDDSVLLPDPTNIGLGLIIPNEPSGSRMNYAYDPSNFLYSKSYGLAPSNTILTVRYMKGGGISANSPSNTVTRLSGIITNQSGTQLNEGEENFPTCINLTPAMGGRDGDTVEELRENSLRAFNEQGRTITLQDYTVRALSLPTKYGSIAKVYAIQDNITNSNTNPNDLLSSNPLALALYVLSYDINGKLITATPTLKQNLKTYMSEFMPLSDAINIKDAFIVNIGINYELIVRPNYTGRDVLLRCTNILRDYFHTSKRTINEPINLSSIYTLLDRVKGVQTVKKIEILNKSGGNYSQYGYDIAGATKNNIVYPSFDPCIFEVKYPEVDIKGRITTL